MTPSIPVALFAYARPEQLKSTLACLRENGVPLIYAFADGPKTPEIEPRVREVREILRQVDWCEIHIIEHESNFGLGSSILAGVSEVFKEHEMLIVFEDDLIFVPGTYQYLCAALEQYKDDPKVMSVTGWTHPLTTPSTVIDQPYFDGRTESWSWGTWARVWKGMDQDAMSLVQACIEKKIDIYRYGADLLEMAKVEKEKNIWAVRFSYLHIFHGGLCMRPPHSMVDHAGFDEQGTNAINPSVLSIKFLEKAPLIPKEWPFPIENPECSSLWQKEYGGRLTIVQHANKKLRYIIDQQKPLIRGVMKIKSKAIKAFQISAWVKFKKWFKFRWLQLFIEKLVLLGGVSEYLAIKWLLRIYQGKYKLDWELSQTPPHFYNHRMGMAKFAFGEETFGPYSYFRGFSASQVIQDGDKLLDIGCGEGFFTKRFFSARCAHVDGVDIEPSAIRCAERENSAVNIKYHLLDAINQDFPKQEYDVIVWDGAIAHFLPETLEFMLQKIAKSLSAEGVFVGSEELGDESSDHLTRFYSLDEFGNLFSKQFKFVEVGSQKYKISGGFIRQEVYWRCANQTGRLEKLKMKKYYIE